MYSKVQTAVKVVLLISSAFLTYLIYTGIMEPIRFNEIYDSRLCEVTSQMENIREAQIAYKREYRSYCGDIQELVDFIDTGYVKIEERKDTSFIYYDKRFEKDMNKDSLIIRILGRESVKEQVFGECFEPNSLLRIFGTDSLFTMEAGKIEKQGVEAPTFVIKAPLSTVFADVKDKYPDQFSKVKDDFWQIGDLNKPITIGNYENTNCRASDTKALKFEKEYEARLCAVTEQLDDLANAHMRYFDSLGSFTDNLDTLSSFMSENGLTFNSSELQYISGTKEVYTFKVETDTISLSRREIKVNYDLEFSAPLCVVFKDLEDSYPYLYHNVANKRWSVSIHNNDPAIDNYENAKCKTE